MKKLTILFAIILVSTFSIFAQSDWNWVNPKPLFNDLNSVSFPSNLVGTAVGNFGSIIRTTDGGLTWEVQNGNTTANLSGVHFTDVNTGFAIGSGVSLKTTDGGEMWTSTSPSGNDIFFRNQSNGIVVGNGGTIRTTTDGGTNWLSKSSGTPRHLYGAYLYNSTECIAVGENGIVLQSNDGGNTWSSETITTTILRSVAAYGSNIIIAGDAGKIFISSNNGVDWVQKTLGISATQFKSVVLNSNGIGYTCGNTTAGSFSFKTTDFGDTWSSQTFPTNGWLFNDIVFLDNTSDNDLVVVCSYGGIFKTTNGGNTWQNQNDNFLNFTGNPPDGQFISAISSPHSDPNKLMGITTSHTIIRSTDSGQNWEIVFSGNPYIDVFLSTFRGIDYLGNGFAFASGEGSINGTAFLIGLVTTNNGDDWSLKPIRQTGATARGMDVAFNSNGIGITVGSNGTIDRSTDNGDTWNLIPSGTTNQLFGISFADQTTVIAVGSNSTILRSTDAGATWETVPSGIGSTTFKDVTFDPNNNSNGIIVGGSSRTLITTDRGQSWEFSLAGTTTALEAVSMDGDNILIVGGGRRLSTDGGQSWTNLPAKSNGLLTGVDLRSGVIVGHNSIIARIYPPNINTQPSFSPPTPTCGTQFTIDVGQPFNFTVAAEDIDAGDDVTLSVTGLPSGSAMNPVLPASGNPVSSDFSWTPDLASVGNYTVTFEITDGVTTPVSCSFDIEVINENVLPVFVEPTPPSGSTQTAYVGSAFTFLVSAQDADATDIISLTSGTLPAGSAMNPVLPASGNPVSSEFSWTPDLASVGLHPVTFEITDGYSNPVTCSFNIEVITPNVAPVFVEPTPASGSTLTVYTGSPLVFTVQAEDTDPGNIVELFVAGLPTGAGMNPPLPFAAPSSVSSDFSWTPTAADVGAYVLIFTAVDNFTASETCTLTVVVEDAPGVVCPLNQLYWKDNPALWPVETLVLGTLHSYDKTQLLAILELTGLRDASVILAKQLIAAKLNAANGAPVPPEVANAITEADIQIGELVIPAGIRTLSPLGLAMLIRAGYLFAYNNNLLTPDCSSTLTKLMALEEEIEIPVSDFTLFDNHPNPFNPTTKIMYTVPEAEQITIKVFNTIGEEVMTLVNEVKQPGIYEVEFRSDGLPSGVYLYRLAAGEFVQTKKMILLR